MLRTIGLILLAGIVGILAYASSRPDNFRIERRIVIDAPADAVYPLIADFRDWPRWSPWERKDPAMTRTFSGADSGVGSAYQWTGNSDVGAGRMEITQAVPPTKVTIALHFIDPVEAQNTTEFLLDDTGDGTTVTWVMTGPSPFFARVIGIFMSMDDMIGKDFESGLTALKAVAEQKP